MTRHRFTRLTCKAFSHNGTQVNARPPSIQTKPQLQFLPFLSWILLMSVPTTTLYPPLRHTWSNFKMLRTDHLNRMCARQMHHRRIIRKLITEHANLTHRCTRKEHDNRRITPKTVATTSAMITTKWTNKIARTSTTLLRQILR